MARPLRIEYPGAVYHLITRGNSNNVIFRDDRDRNLFLSILNEVVKRYNWKCYAFCLMCNHYHLLVETLDANLSLGMRQLNGIYTQKYNKKNDLHGHIFQGRFKSIIVDKENYLIELARYIELNPVRAGLVKIPWEWKWSSCACRLFLANIPSFLDVDFILSQFGRDKIDAITSYKDFLQDGINERNKFKDLQNRTVLGDENFVNRIKKFIKNNRFNTEIASKERFVYRKTLKELFYGVMDEKIRNRTIYHAHIENGYTLSAIGKFLGLHYSTLSRIVKNEAVIQFNTK